jgi:hypothetical protein
MSRPSARATPSAQRQNRPDSVQTTPTRSHHHRHNITIIIVTQSLIVIVNLHAVVVAPSVELDDCHVND